MEQEKSSVVTMKKNSRKGSISSMFMHADGVDLLLMIFGFIGSVGDGLITPLVLFISSHLMNNIGAGSSAVSLADSFSNSINTRLEDDGGSSQSKQPSCSLSGDSDGQSQVPASGLGDTS
ncbi:abc transporter b family member 15 [Quercus suber]|uniref:Abc transporter b family member 15 n=1 Tax=Quercus suber TaxID=58331 RepID=A0AAW0JGF2_QUESU